MFYWSPGLWSDYCLTRVYLNVLFLKSVRLIRIFYQGKKRWQKIICLL